MEREEILGLLEDLNRKKLQAAKNIDGVKMEMNKIKRKVRNLIEDPLF